MSLVLLLGTAAAAVALGGGASDPGPTPVSVVPFKFIARPTRAPGPPPITPVSEQWSVYTAAGAAAEIVGDVPAGRRYRIIVRAYVPDIPGYVRFPLKAGTKRYYYLKGPAGSDPVLAFVSSAANAVGSAVNTAGTIIDDPRVAALGAAVEIGASIAGKLSDAVARYRVRTWSAWRAGRYGKDAAREAMRANVARWFAPDLADAQGVLAKSGEWTLGADAPGEWPVLSGGYSQPSWGAGRPAVRAETLAGGEYWRLVVSLPTTTYRGEVRWWVRVQSQD